MAARYNKGPVREMTRDERVYLAGLLDGEGSFMLISAGRGTISVSVRIAMCHKPTMEWVATVLGRQIGPHSLGKARQRVARQMWRVEVANLHGVVSLINQVLPFLITKREVASALLEFCQLRLSSRYFTRSGEWGYGDKEHELQSRVRELNRIGVPVTH